MLTCQSCDGTGKSWGLINYVEGGCRPGEVNCSHCDGTGEHTEERLEWERLGDELGRPVRMYKIQEPSEG